MKRSALSFTEGGESEGEREDLNKGCGRYTGEVRLELCE